MTAEKPGKTPENSTSGETGKKDAISERLRVASDENLGEILAEILIRLARDRTLLEELTKKFDEFDANDPRNIPISLDIEETAKKVSASFTRKTEIQQILAERKHKPA